MQIPRDQIISLIESCMGGQQAQQASQELPDQVGHEQHAGLLQKFKSTPRNWCRSSAAGSQTSNRPPKESA